MFMEVKQAEYRGKMRDLLSRYSDGFKRDRHDRHNQHYKLRTLTDDITVDVIRRSRYRAEVLIMVSDDKREKVISTMSDVVSRMQLDAKDVPRPSTRMSGIGKHMAQLLEKKAGFMD